MVSFYAMCPIMGWITSCQDALHSKLFTFGRIQAKFDQRTLEIGGLVCSGPRSGPKAPRSKPRFCPARAHRNGSRRSSPNYGSSPVMTTSLESSNSPAQETASVARPSSSATAWAMAAKRILLSHSSGTEIASRIGASQAPCRSLSNSNPSESDAGLPGLRADWRCR